MSNASKRGRPPEAEENLRSKRQRVERVEEEVDLTLDSPKGKRAPGPPSCCPRGLVGKTSRVVCEREHD